MKTGKTGGKTGDATMTLRVKNSRKIIAMMCLLISSAFLSQMAQADTRANLHSYCKRVMHSNNISVVYKHKKRAWKCTKYVRAMGFNTTYNKPVKYLWINPRNVCRRQFHSDWSRVNSRGIYCRSVTRVRFCNRYHNKIWMALGYYANRRDGWRTQGWWTINPHSCMSYNFPAGYRGNIYIYGMDNRGHHWSGSTPLCLKKYDRFRINNSDKAYCRAQGYQRKRFMRYRVRPGVSRFNFN